MTVFLNGRFVPEEQAVVSVFDRGFLYGDGLFETLRVCRGRPFRWGQHLSRLQAGAALLRLPLPFAPEELRRFAEALIAQNQMPDCLLRLQLTRGIGARGYSVRDATQPALVMSLHPAPALDPHAPPRWCLALAAVRVPAGDPLAVVKTTNKLPQILARAEAEARGADEALLLNTDGHVAEAAGSNLFWIENGVIGTPPLAAGVLAGVTRGVVLQLCAARGWTVHERRIGPGHLRGVEGVFLTLSTLGVVEAVELEGQPLNRSPLVETLRADYLQLLAEETRAPTPASA